MITSHPTYFLVYTLLLLYRSLQGDTCPAIHPWDLHSTPGLQNVDQHLYHVPVDLQHVPVDLDHVPGYLYRRTHVSRSPPAIQHDQLQHQHIIGYTSWNKLQHDRSTIWACLQRHDSLQHVQLPPYWQLQELFTVINAELQPIVMNGHHQDFPNSVDAYSHPATTIDASRRRRCHTADHWINTFATEADAISLSNPVMEALVNISTDT